MEILLEFGMTRLPTIDHPFIHPPMVDGFQGAKVGDLIV